MSDLGVRLKTGSDRGLLEFLGNFVSVPSATLAAIQQVFVSVNNGENTGFAVYNPNLAAVDMNICMIDDDGNERADVRIFPSIRVSESLSLSTMRPSFKAFSTAVGNNFTGTMTISTTQWRSAGYPGGCCRRSDRGR